MSKNDYFESDVQKEREKTFAEFKGPSEISGLTPKQLLEFFSPEIYERAEKIALESIRHVGIADKIKRKWCCFVFQTGDKTVNIIIILSGQKISAIFCVEHDDTAAEGALCIFDLAACFLADAFLEGRIVDITHFDNSLFIDEAYVSSWMTSEQFLSSLNEKGREEIIKYASQYVMGHDKFEDNYHISLKREAEIVEAALTHKKKGIHRGCVLQPRL